MGTMAFHLTAALGRPYPIVVNGRVGSTTSVSIVDPDGGTTPLPLVDADDVGTYTADFTPSIPGNHTVTIASDDTDVDGLAVTLVAGRNRDACSCDGETVAACCDAGGLRLGWPCPNVASLRCIAAFSADQVRRWAGIATGTLFGDTCRRWPGCNNYAKLRPAVGAWCLAPLPARYGQHLGLDLWPTLRYPALEIVDIEISGASVGATGWRIEGKRWLVPEGSTAWPDQDLHAADAEAGTWSVLVRYGKPPPAMAVAARDQLMLQMLLGNEVPATGTVDVLPSGLTQLVENGRTMTFDPEASTRLYDEAKRRWPCTGTNRRARVVDLAERTARGSSAIHVVPGDPTPAAVEAFAGSGCNLDAKLAALSA